MLSWRWAFWVLQWSITLPKRQNVRSSLWQHCSLPNSHRSLQLNSKLSLPPIQSHLHYPGGRSTLLFWPTNVEVKVMVHRRSRLRSTGTFDCFVVHLFAGEGRQLNVPRVVDPRPALPPNWSKRLYQHPTGQSLCFLKVPLVFSCHLKFSLVFSDFLTFPLPRFSTTNTSTTHVHGSLGRWVCPAFEKFSRKEPKIFRKHKWPMPKKERPMHHAVFFISNLSHIDSPMAVNL